MDASWLFGAGGFRGGVLAMVTGGTPQLLLKIFQKKLLLGLLVIACQINGCATIVTTYSPDEVATEACQSKNCAFLPRIYSGTVMDFCGATASGSGQGGGLMLWDLPLSFVADTLILPYTVYKQITEGNISTKEICLAEKEKEKAAQEEKRKQLILQGR